MDHHRLREFLIKVVDSLRGGQETAHAFGRYGAPGEDIVHCVSSFVGKHPGYQDATGFTAGLDDSDPKPPAGSVIPAQASGSMAISPVVTS